mgnify:CR=1 FL=1
MRNLSKKSLACILVCVMVCLMITPAVSAYTLKDAESLSDYYAKRINVFAEAYGATSDEAINAVDLKVLCENVAEGGYDLCYVYSGVSSEEEGYEIVENCLFKFYAAQKPYKLGLYLINNTEALTLSEGCEKGIITLNGEEGKFIRRLINAPLLAEFAEVNENSKQNYLYLMDFLAKNKAYSTDFKADFVGTADEFEVVVYENIQFGENFEEIIGGYTYSNKVCQYPYGLGVYALKGDEVLTLGEAFEKGIDLEKVNELLKKSNITVSEAEGIPTEATEPATSATEPSTSVTMPDATVPATEPAPTEAPDYSKFYGEIYSKFPEMKDGDSATVLLYLDYDESYADDEGDMNKESVYAAREAANKDFLQRYDFDEKDIYFVSKYRRQVVVNATKAQLTRFWCDSEVNNITDFEMDLGLSSGVTGADVQYSLEEYLADKGFIDGAGTYLINAGESNGIPLVRYTILPTADEARALRYQNYIFISNAHHAAYHLGFFAVVDGKFVTFEEALEMDIIGIDDAAKVFIAAYKIENLGDMNNDGEVNIKDVTLLQKALVGLENTPKITMDCEDFRDIDVTDFNADGKLDIRDVTAIQKFIAKM